MTKVSTYSLPFHTFQIMSAITQELCSVNIIVLSKFDKRVLKAKIDLLINVSKVAILFIANIPLGILRRQRPNNLQDTLFMQHEFYQM